MGWNVVLFGFMFLLFVKYFISNGNTLNNEVVYSANCVSSHDRMGMVSFVMGAVCLTAIVFGRVTSDMDKIIFELSSFWQCKHA